MVSWKDHLKCISMDVISMPYKNKEMKNKNAREYYLAHKDKISINSKERYQKKKEEIRKKCKEYYENNKDIINEKRKKRFKLNKEKEYKNQQKWNINNKDKLIKIKKKYKENHKKEIQNYNKKHRKVLRDYYNSYKRKWRSNNKNKTKNEKLKKYNLTIEDFYNLLKIQKNRCGICKKKFNNSYSSFPCVDHNHKTGTIRGILCRNCNSGVGGLHDDIEIISNALKWVKKKNTVNIIKNVPFLLTFNKRKKYSLKRDHNITPEYFNTLLYKQAGSCGVCLKKFTKKIPFNPQIDHNHKTNQIRGLLCRRCNLSIGLLQDNPIIFKNAIKWLKKEKVYA